jgi:uncharacterized membrane protein
MSKSEKGITKNKNILEKSAAKRKMILNTKKTSRLPWVFAGVLCVLAIGGVVYFATQDTRRDTAYTNPTGVQMSETAVSYPVDLFSDGKARYFQYKIDDAITIQYFILKSSDGVIRAAFDACDVCWPAGKGYEQSGDVMVCRNCGRQFASVKINEVKGGCNPAPLKRKLDGEKLVLEIKDILSGKQYFNFG